MVTPVRIPVKYPTQQDVLDPSFISNYGRPAGLWTPTFGGANIAKDFSGHGNNGTLNGGVTLAAGSGQFPAAWKFDGSTGYAKSSSPAMTVTTGFTLAALYRPISISTSRQMALYVGTGASNGYGISASSGTSADTSGKISVLYGGVAWNVTTTPYVAGNWHLIVATQLSGTLTVYLNNTGSIGTFVSTPLTPTLSTWLGWDGGNAKANGNLAFAAAWPTAFSAAQVSSLYSTLMYGVP